MIYLDLVTTLSVGLLIGAEFTVSAFINPILERLDSGLRMKTISLFAKRLGAAMPFWYALSFVLLLAEAVLRRHSVGEHLLIAASTLWLAVIVLTLMFLVPINNRMMRLHGSCSAEASLREHNTWDTLHRGRVVVLAASMVCFLLAVLR
ncbi:MAG TPA: DUF1772 domain-containing protein [Acidobacteriaceae bacterium]|nr:DUF1772 domain-containing protein [Acidobacteriaceae bacterium]